MNLKLLSKSILLFIILFMSMTVLGTEYFIGPESYAHKFNQKNTPIYGLSGGVNKLIGKSFWTGTLDGRLGLGKEIFATEWQGKINAIYRPRGTKFRLVPGTGIGFRHEAFAGEAVSNERTRLFYIPIALKTIYQHTPQIGLITLLEYDYLFSGGHERDIKTARGSDVTVKSSHNKGHGLHFEAGLQRKFKKNWTRFLAFYRFWNVEYNAINRVNDKIKNKEVGLKAIIFF